MQLRYPLSIFTLPGLVCVPLVFGGCSNAAEPTTTATVTAAPSTMPAAALPHTLPVAVPRARRLMRRVLDAAGRLPIGAEQRAQLDGIAAAVAPKIIATKAAHDAVLETLAAQVEQGTIDRAALQPKLDAFRASAADEHSAHQAALTVVNGILTDSERSALADMMQQTPPEAARATHRNGSRKNGLLRGIGLSDEERAWANAASAAGGPLERRILVLERVLPILTPAQRSTVATRLRP